MKMHIVAAAIAFCVCHSGVSLAQEMQPALNFETAHNISSHCQVHAKEAGYKIAIAVYDQHGTLTHFVRMDGASVGAVEAALWKGRSAAIWEYPSVETAKWNPMVPYVASSEGGTTIFTKEGRPIGGIGVSGAPSEFDGECGRKAILQEGLSITRPE